METIKFNIVNIDKKKNKRSHKCDDKENCVYLHYYDNESIPFYVGQGSITRAYAFSYHGRNKYWADKVKDFNKVKVKIVAKNISLNKRLRIEKEYINLYYKSGNLTNIQIGINDNRTDIPIDKGRFRIIALDKDKNKIDEFISYEDAAYKAYSTKADIKNAIKSHKLFRNCYWICIRGDYDKDDYKI